MDVWTIGHSTRSLEELIELLRASEIALLADVRRFPASRRHPHFARESLEAALPAIGIEYAWLPDLGGRRSPSKTSPHIAWRVPAFAAYADYMQTEPFERSARELLTRARSTRTAIMCAEALPQRCHRRLIADWLLIHGARVRHIMTRTRIEEHALPEFARVDDGVLYYDRGQTDLGV